MNIARPREKCFLLLSDIHFGKDSASPDFGPPGSKGSIGLTSPISMKASLINSVRGRAIEGMLVSGDLTELAGPDQFKQCLNVISSIATELSINPERLYFALGNHDVNWNIAALSSPSSANGDVDSGYKHVAASVGGLMVGRLNELTTGPLPGTGILQESDYVIYILNTGYSCFSDQEWAHGKVGEAQLNWLLENVPEYASDRTKWHIVLVHHHPFNYKYPTPTPDISTVEEGPELLEIFGKNGIDFVYHGHRHHPTIQTHMQGDWYQPITFLCAGSLAAGHTTRRNGEIPNLFHILTLKERLISEGAIGHVETFQYNTCQGWHPVAENPLIPLDSISWFSGVHSDDERNNDTQGLLSAVRQQHANNKELVIELPAFSDLPLSLRCMRYRELNSLLCKSAASFPSFRLSGEYPKRVHVIISS